jgi:hypothetical protein
VRSVLAVVNQRFYHFLEAFDGLLTVRLTAQVDGVAAAILAPLYIVSDDLTGTPVNCECCHNYLLLSFGNPAIYPVDVTVSSGKSKRGWGGKMPVF